MSNGMRWIAAGCLSLTLAAGARADTRRYVWTYEAVTMPKGLAEVEYYLTAEVPDTSAREVNKWTHQAELEYGLTERLDVSMYQVWKQVNTTKTSEFKYNGFKLRSRYRFDNAETWPVRSLLYVEYKRDAALKNPDVLEGKLVLSRDIGRFNASYNQVVERALGSGAEIEYAYAAGVRYEIIPECAVGVESTGNYSKGGYYIGPTVSLQPSGKLFCNLGALFGIDDAAKDVQVRFLTGIPF